MSCAEVRSLLPLRPLDALEEDEAAIVSKHLSGCSSCTESARALERAYEPLREGSAVAPPPGLWEKVAGRLDAPAPAGETAPAEAPARELSIALVCCFCKGAIERADATYCASCLAPHHGDCFRAHGRCSAFGCEETRTVRPRLEPAEPVRLRHWTRKVVPLRVAAAAICGTAVLGVAITATLEARRRADLKQRARDEAERRAEAEAKRPRAKWGDLPPRLHEDAAVAADPRRLEKLEMEIAKLLADVAELHEQGRAETLTTIVAKVKDMIKEYGLLHDAEQNKVKRWEKALEELKVARTSPKADERLAAAERTLVEMTRSFEKARYKEVEAELPHIVDLVESMKQEGALSSKPDAAAILDRAYWLVYEAKRLRSAALESPRPPTTADDPRITLDAVDVVPAELAETIAKNARRNVLVAPGARSLEKRVTFHWKDRPWRDALADLARAARGSVLWLDGGTPVLAASAPFIIQLKDAAVRPLLRELVKKFGASVVIAPDVEGGVTLELEVAYWPRALEAVEKQLDLRIERRGWTFVVSKAPVKLGTENYLSPDAALWHGVPSFEGREKDAKVDLIVNNAPIEAVLSEVARRIDKKEGSVAGAPHAEDLPRVSLNVRAAPWRDVVSFLALAGRLSVSSDPVRLSLLSDRFDAVVARGAPADVLLPLLAKVYGHELEAHGCTDEIDGVEIHGAPPAEALAAIAAANGWRLDLRGDRKILLRRGDRAGELEARRKTRPKRNGTRIVFRGDAPDRAPEMRVQALVSVPFEECQAIVNGRVVTKGSAAPPSLRDGSSDGIRVVDIEEDGVVFERGHERVKVALPAE